MPALAITQPNYPKFLDLKDADSPVDRQIDSALASVSNAFSAINTLKIDPNTGVTRGGTKYLRPAHISAAEIATYETAVDNALTAFATVLKNVKTLSTL